MTEHNSLDQRHTAELNRLSLSVRLGSFRCDFLYWGMIQGAWRNYAHHHSFVEVCYAFAGEGTFTIHDRQHQVGAGDLFVARPGEVHDIVSSQGGALGICFWAYSVERLPHQDGESVPL